MAERKAILLRLDPVIHEAMQRWAADDLRSLNAQIEFVMRQTLQQQGRLRQTASAAGAPPGVPSGDEPTV